jgi:catechol 2,3-dioxygenase-like lactoylglutathione lyase family enzyme
MRRGVSTATTAPVAVLGLGHIAINTADLDRFRRFYEGMLGIPLGAIMRMGFPPYLRHATFHVSAGLVLHVFEVPGYDPQSQGIGTDIGERGRIDHFAFLVPDAAALAEVAERLRAAGASEGVVQTLGPVLSVHATDPDGLQFEVTCANLAFPAHGSDEEVVEEVGLADWVTRMNAPAPS